MKSLLNKIFPYVGFIIAIAIGVAVTRFFFPGNGSNEPRSYPPVNDSLAIEGAVSNAIRIRDDSISTLWDKIVRLQKRTPATGYYGTPSKDPYPPRELRISSKDSMIIAGVAVPAIDAPISVEADRSTVTVTTRNEWLRSRGEPYVKVYRWDRLTRDFAFALNETTSPNRLDGINLYFDKRAFEWDGFGLIAGSQYLGIPLYVGVDIRVILWEKLEISPRLLSVPEARIEARWRF